MIPYHQSETNFRRFEAEIGAYLHNAPRPWEVNPKGYGLSPATVLARLRDAIASLRLHRWKTPFFEAFLEHEAQMRVVFYQEKIFIVNAEEHAKAVRAGHNAPASKDTPSASLFIDFNLIPPSKRHLVMDALAVLADKRILSSAVLKDPPEGFADVQAQYDIALTPKGENTYLLI